MPNAAAYRTLDSDLGKKFSHSPYNGIDHIGYQFDPKFSIYHYAFWFAEPRGRCIITNSLGTPIRTHRLPARTCGRRAGLSVLSDGNALGATRAANFEGGGQGGRQAY